MFKLYSFYVALALILSCSLVSLQAGDEKSPKVKVVEVKGSKNATVTDTDGQPGDESGDESDDESGDVSDNEDILNGGEDLKQNKGDADQNEAENRGPKKEKKGKTDDTSTADDKKACWSTTKKCCVGVGVAVAVAALAGGAYYFYTQQTDEPAENAGN